MADKIESDNTCCPDMPMEVLTDIFTHLPVKSLVRFTCVSKSLLHLIRKDRQFAMKHYLARTRPPSCRLMDNVDLIIEYFGKYGRGCRSSEPDEVLRLTMYSLTERKTFRIVKKLEFGPGLEVYSSNICHGVMCIYVSASGAGARILLCNPAIREVVPLPASYNILRHGLPRFGLGFDSTRSDYKVVAAHAPSLFSGRSSWLVYVYSVCEGRWRSLDEIGCLEEFESLEGAPVLNGNGRFLNWLGCRKSVKAVKGLVSFDMVIEAFLETPMPECVYPIGWRDHHLLPSSQWRACLCCSPYPSFDLRGDGYFNGIELWVLTDENSWNKQFSVMFPDQEVVWPMNLWMNDKEFFVYVRKKGGSVEEVFHYDLGSQQFKRTGRHGMLVNPDGYTESLVSIKELMSSCLELNQEDRKLELEDDGGPSYFVREVTRRNDICWSYNFKLA